MREHSQRPRYAAVLDACCGARRPGAVLDVGCGEGLLAEPLLERHARYVGVDVSREAIALAAARHVERATFVLADAARYRPDERFDVVIFNECLYHFEAPVEVARRYEAVLRPGGAFVVSIYGAAKNDRLWQELRAVYQSEHRVTSSHASGRRWTIERLVPIGRSA